MLLFRSNTRNPRRGFTLIEMMIAMGLLVVGVTSVLGLLAFGAALQRTAERRGEVSLAAEQVIADLRDTFTLNEDGTLTDMPAAKFERTIPGHPLLKARVEVKKNPKLDGEYFATISIEWIERGAARSEEFRTILQREAPFGARSFQAARSFGAARKN